MNKGSACAIPGCVRDNEEGLALSLQIIVNSLPLT